MDVPQWRAANNSKDAGKAVKLLSSLLDKIRDNAHANLHPAVEQDSAEYPVRTDLIPLLNYFARSARAPLNSLFLGVAGSGKSNLAKFLATNMDGCRVLLLKEQSMGWQELGMTGELYPDNGEEVDYVYPLQSVLKDRPSGLFVFRVPYVRTARRGGVSMSAIAFDARVNEVLSSNAWASTNTSTPLHLLIDDCTDVLQGDVASQLAERGRRGNISTHIFQQPGMAYQSEFQSNAGVLGLFRLLGHEAPTHALTEHFPDIVSMLRRLNPGQLFFSTTHQGGEEQGVYQLPYASSYEQLVDAQAEEPFTAVSLPVARAPSLSPLTVGYHCDSSKVRAPIVKDASIRVSR